MTATLFLLFVAALAGLVVWLGARFLRQRTARLAFIALIVWLAYVAVLGQSGLLRDPTPPGPLLILAPVALFLAVFAIRTFKKTEAPVVPLALLLGLQAFRIVVEFFIHQLWSEGLVPKMLTYSGANVDIWIGVTAPLAAWFATRGPWGRRVSIGWNILGLLALANVVSRAILTTPGPLHLIHPEVPNQMFAAAPYQFIPGFFVPLAVVLHVAALKQAAIESQTFNRSSS
jgi:hypothetical protein